MILVETTNEHLQSANTKLKTEMQNLKKNLKALDKKTETTENEKKHALEETSQQTNIPICQQSSNERKLSQTGLMPTQIIPDSNLTSNPFHVLTTIEDDDENIQHPHGNNIQLSLSNRGMWVFHTITDTGQLTLHSHAAKLGLRSTSSNAKILAREFVVRETTMGVHEIRVVLLNILAI